jgi:LysM repeat protein
MSISKLTRVFGEAFFLILVIAVPLSVQAGFFSKLFTSAEANETDVVLTASVSAVDITLLTALQNPNPLAARGGAEIVVDDNVLKSTGPVGEDEIAEYKSSSGEIRVYTVREGDSLSQIAEMFDVTTNTIMWANDITRATSIQAGDTLVILPIAGVRHVVKKGDTVSTIAKKYEGDVDEILSYNQLDSADDISVGDTVIIPGGAMHMAPARVSAGAQPVRVSGAAAVSTGFVHPAPGAARTQGLHGYNAVDLAAGYGTAIRAAAAGEVIVSKTSGWNGGYGNYIVVRHASGAQTLYAHLMSNNVGVGSYVSQGQVIGGMGSTGKSTGTHLHFEVRGARNPF